MSGHTPAEGFSRACRLLTAGQYAEVFSARKVLRGALFALHFRSNNLESARLGVVVPKKQAKTAVLRNAIKRQARELFRRRRAELPAVDLILRLAQPIRLGRRPINATDKAGWREEIGRLLVRLEGGKT